MHLLEEGDQFVGGASGGGAVVVREFPNDLSVYTVTGVQDVKETVL